MIPKYGDTYNEPKSTSYEPNMGILTHRGTNNEIEGLFTNKHGVGFSKGEGNVSGFTCG